MKLLLIFVVFIAFSNGMYRNVVTERLRTPLNELYLLAGTQVDLKDFISVA
jgi:hypothetical protein